MVWRIEGTWHRWFDPIMRDNRNRYSNAMLEGFKNKIKLIQPTAYGLRNEHKRRVMLLQTF
jgi:transposase